MTLIGTEESGMDRSDLMYGIREAIGIRTTGTAATISKERTRRIVATLEFMSDEELCLLFPLSQHARQLSLLEPSAKRERAGIFDESPFTGEDCYFIQDALYGNRTDEIMTLARSFPGLPEDMPLRSAAKVMNKVRSEMFPLDTAELVTAHLNVAHGFEAAGLAYTAQGMMVVNMHPDKTKVIMALMESNRYVPTHRDVLTHHGVEPVLFDGVL